jgi:hypothetical protein
VLIGRGLLALCLVLLAGCGAGPSDADREAARAVLALYLQDRATRVTAAGAELDGEPLTTARLDPGFARGVAGHAKELDSRRRLGGYTRAEVMVTLTELDVDGVEAKAWVRDHTKLYLPPGEPEATEHSVERVFTLRREGAYWAISGAWVEESVGALLPITDIGT